ncbi:unnamed protein product [Owenia fusiformis]|uniref:Alpha-1,3-glucosyltransferase n=1 Tax=Owenia fusiformis TaxID=6347 RepID=A0A8J1TIY5_OWEFU|nr:unnamed protein product [Owenia fusiformis]
MENCWSVFGLFTAIKLLLIPSYRSTDFEVHRNWLAVTNSLPLEKWYFEKTSEWTLDYPPMFAWFEFFLSQFARFFDPNMLVLRNLKYASFNTILFQRLSVIVTDLVYVFAVKGFCDCYSGKKTDKDSPSNGSSLILAILLLGNFGLILVDHIHFQYNGFLFGVMLLSIVRIYQGRHMEAALWFTTLLNLKHIYLYIAPAYFVYLLRHYCFNSKKDGGVAWKSFSLQRVIHLGFIVVMVFGVSFGPFIAAGQIGQVLSRLFPFKRGLCHAYWAPNVWALYNMADKTLAIIGAKMGKISKDELQGASMTGGLVQEYSHTVLPSIPPVVTLICTVVAILPGLVHQWMYLKGPRGFVKCLTLCALGAYLFGWHVHEKAIIIVIIPLSLLALDGEKYGRIFLLMSTVGHFSLLPLIFTKAETPIKICMLVAYQGFAFISLNKYYNRKSQGFSLPLLNKLESLYTLGLVPLLLYTECVHRLIGLQQRLPFLPLMMTSVYCAIGVVYTSGLLYKTVLMEGRLVKGQKDLKQQ